MTDNLDKLVGRIIFCEVFDFFMRVTEIERTKTHLDNGEEITFTMILGDILFGRHPHGMIEPEDLGDNAFVVPEDFPMSKIEEYGRAGKMIAAAAAVQKVIELDIPAVKRKRELDELFPF